MLTENNFTYSVKKSQKGFDLFIDFECTLVILTAKRNQQTVASVFVL